MISIFTVFINTASADISSGISIGRNTDTIVVRGPQ